MKNHSKPHPPKNAAQERLDQFLKKAPETQLELPSRVSAHCSAQALLSNARAIQDLVPTHALLPMIKANAYGHGGVWAARTLVDIPQLYAFGVATLKEGAEVRKALSGMKRQPRILVFSGCFPWSEATGQYCEKHGLIPVIGADSDWDVFFKQGWPERIRYELEFNTGMNRLGMNLNTARTVIKNLKELPGTAHPEGILSHLASAESPDAAISRRQREAYVEMRRTLGTAFPAAQFHLGNSSAIWNEKNWGLAEMTDVVRPGISLYGVPPWQGAALRGIEAVLTLEATVLVTRALKAGEQIGYGGTFTVETDRFFCATLGIGYADGLPRALGNKGYAWLNGQESRFVGAVSMDLSAVSCTSSTRAGDLAQILGPRVDIWAQARAANTIPYELLTSISARVARFYD